MARTPRVPTYRYHKASRQAVVVIRGKSFYLGPWNSPESRAEYARVIAESWRPDPGPVASASTPASAKLTINELMVAYWNRRVLPYYVKDGRPTSERDNIRQAIRFVRKLYGMTPASDFGPLALKAVRGTMIESGRCRTLINKDVHRIRAMFRWAASEQLYPGVALHDLKAVEPLEKGRSEAKERAPVAPVARDAVLATLRRVSPQVAAMIRLQLLTAARPGEVCSIRPCDVDRTTDPEVWVYRPSSHKTEHHGRERVIVIGPKGQDVLRPWLDRDPSSYCFSPAEVVAARESRRMPRSSSRKAARPEPDGRYSKDSYRVAVARACDRAFPHPVIRKKRGKPLTDEDAAELKAWRKEHRWHPHQLRHTRATEIRREFDSEAAQVILGHSKPDTTLLYAERDMARAREVMKRIG